MFKFKSIPSPDEKGETEKIINGDELLNEEQQWQMNIWSLNLPLSA